MFFRPLIIIFLLARLSVDAQSFYDVSGIQKIEINFQSPSWDYILDTAAMNSGNYIMAQTVKINGVLFDSVGVKYKGNSSYDSTYQKNPLHIELDNYKNQDYFGIKDIKLSNCYQDPSMIREALAYNILKNYMHSPLANYAQVYINGVYMGLYTNTESVTKKFCADHFYSNTGTFIKCNPIVTPSSNTKSNLKKLTGDSSAYFNFYEMKSNAGWNDLAALCDSVTNKPSNISSIVDMDRAIWMLAFDNLTVNLDSYMGAFCQNYYLYKDQTGRYNPVVWDLNMSFGGFPFLGSANSSLASQNITGLQNLSVNVHATDPYWPLINAVYSNPQYKRMYIAHMRTMIKENFSNGNYLNLYNQFKSVIDTAVQSDTKKFFSYTQFQNALNTNYAVGSYSVPGIQTLMSARISYLNSTADFTAATPTISNVSATSTATLNAPLTITANIINATGTGVYLGYRFTASAKFQQVPMFDDGAHNDGASNDNVFGAIFNLNGNAVQYYVYAENGTAGIFSPERAEHEFYTVYAIQSPIAGQVVINEFLAKNTSDVKNEFNLYEDWIELYNTGNIPLSLGGYYLSDDYSNKTKYAFPSNTVIQPNSFLIVWADNLSGGSQLHANFKLSDTGEEIMLSDGLTGVLDSVSFGTQNSDISSGRCPDGIGPFSVLNFPSHGMTNCAVGLNENVLKGFIKIFPNPATHQVTIEMNNTLIKEVSIYNNLGSKVIATEMNGSSIINIESLPAGIYFVKAGALSAKLLVTE